MGACATPLKPHSTHTLYAVDKAGRIECQHATPQARRPAVLRSAATRVLGSYRAAESLSTASNAHAHDVGRLAGRHSERRAVDLLCERRGRGLRDKILNESGRAIQRGPEKYHIPHVPVKR